MFDAPSNAHQTVLAPASTPPARRRSRVGPQTADPPVVGVAKSPPDVQGVTGDGPAPAPADRGARPPGRLVRSLRKRVTGGRPLGSPRQDLRWNACNISVRSRRGGDEPRGSGRRTSGPKTDGVEATGRRRPAALSLGPAPNRGRSPLDAQSDGRRSGASQLRRPRGTPPGDGSTRTPSRTKSAEIDRTPRREVRSYPLPRN